MKRIFTLPATAAILIMFNMVGVIGEMSAQTQPFWTCDAKKYQSIEVNDDYWLYEVETNPVNLKPLFNITAAGATNDLNSLIFNKDDGYMYIIQIRSPHNLYRIGSDYSVVNLGPVSGFDSNAAVNAAAENDDSEMIYRDTRTEDFYTMDLSNLSVTKICNFAPQSGLDNNVGDFAFNPANGLYYGTRDDSDILAEIDLDNCTETHITMSRSISGAFGAFWIGADGKGYGYSNETGELWDVDLTTGELGLIGQGSSTSQTDGCSCEGISIHQEVDTDTTVHGDTIIITITIYNEWSTHLSTVLFSDTLCAGMTWASEPFNLTGGIIIDNTNLTGTDKPDVTISHLPKGKCTFQLVVTVPIDYAGDDPCDCQANLGDLPARIGAPIPSDNPKTFAVNDANRLVILSEDECIGEWNASTVEANFGFDHKSVDVFSNKPMENVVLEFYDGTHQTVHGVGMYNDRINPSGSSADKCITGVWIKTACNGSGDGPEYGRFIPSPIWDGLCGGNIPTQGVVFEHIGTVISTGGPSVIHFDDIQFDPPTGHVPINDHPGHNSTGTGVTGPEIPDPPAPSGPTGPPFIPGHRFNSLADGQISVFPNPARSYSSINVEGIDHTADWQVHIVTIDGKFAATQQLTGSQINLADMNLVTGIYFLVFENGQDRKSIKLIVTE